MQELIERLERLSQPDRALDFDIYIWLGAKPPTNNNPLYWTAPDGINRHYESLVPRYTGSVDAARSLLPWDKHPGATFKSTIIQSGMRGFYCFAEFTWPSTECQGRARTEPVATCIAALLAIEKTERQLAPYKKPRAAIAPSDRGETG